MMSNVSTLNVLLYGEVIGTITHVGSDRTLFAFTEAYIENTARPILSLGFKDSLGELITEFRPTQTKLMPFFSNLLPEEAMRTYLSERAGVNPEREFFLLWVLGQDLSGAITIKPADGEALPPNINAPVGDSEGGEGLPMRFSLAGVQLKFSAVQKARGGLTIPVDGAGGSWIVKLPSSVFEGVPENEFSMMELARQIGIDVPETKLIRMDEIEKSQTVLSDLAVRLKTAGHLPLSASIEGMIGHQFTWKTLRKYLVYIPAINIRKRVCVTLQKLLAWKGRIVMSLSLFVDWFLIP